MDWRRSGRASSRQEPNATVRCRRDLGDADMGKSVGYRPPVAPWAKPAETAGEERGTQNAEAFPSLAEATSGQIAQTVDGEPSVAAPDQLSRGERNNSKPVEEEHQKSVEKKAWATTPTSTLVNPNDKADWPVLGATNKEGAWPSLRATDKHSGWPSLGGGVGGAVAAGECKAGSKVLSKPTIAVWAATPGSPEEEPVRKTLKPKPQKNYSIFDVVKSAAIKKLTTPSTPSPAPNHPQQPQQQAPSSNSHLSGPSPFCDKELAKQPTKPRKKKLTSLKKRILLERVERYYAVHPDERPKATVQLLNAARHAELADDDEKDEILQDVTEICRALAPTLGVEVADEDDGGGGWATLEAQFASGDEARKVIDGLKGRIVGGEPLRLRLKGEQEDAAIVKLVNVLSVEETEDPEELEEVMSDLRAICEACAKPTSMVAEGVNCYITFTSADEANEAMRELQKTVIGGRQLECELMQSTQSGGSRGRTVALALRGACTGEALGDDEEVEEIEGDMARIALGHGVQGATVRVVREGDGAGDVWLEFEERSLAERAQDALAGLVLSGEPITIELVESPSHEEPPASNLVESKKTGALLKLPPKYAEARRVPKLPNSERTRFYAQEQPLDAVLDELVADLLGRLFDFQERVRLNDPLKAKMRRRLVFGLREVRRGVRANNVKCIVLAPNVDEGDSLNDQITNLLASARQAQIPIVFALGKRKLGKALRKKVAVSVVGIYSGDGAHQEYRAVLARLKLITEDPLQAVDPAKRPPKSSKNEGTSEESQQRSANSAKTTIKTKDASPRRDQIDAGATKPATVEAPAPAPVSARPNLSMVHAAPFYPGSQYRPPNDAGVSIIVNPSQTHDPLVPRPAYVHHPAPHQCSVHSHMPVLSPRVSLTPLAANTDHTIDTEAWPALPSVADCRKS